LQIYVCTTETAMADVGGILCSYWVIPNICGEMWQCLVNISFGNKSNASGKPHHWQTARDQKVTGFRLFDCYHTLYLLAIFVHVQNVKATELLMCSSSQITEKMSS